ncbi:Transcription initiation factor TFIID subunit 4B [Lemmus lemmus]
MAPAAALPVQVESTRGALGPVTKAPPGSVCVECVAPQPLPSPVGTLVTKLVPVTTLHKLGSPRLLAPQIVTVKTPGTKTIQLPANLQLPPGTVLIKSNNGELMLVSPQQAVTGAKTTSNITPRPAVPVNTQSVKICSVPNSSSQLMKKVAVAPVNNQTQIGTTVASTASSASLRTICDCTSCQASEHCNNPEAIKFGSIIYPLK